MLISGTKPTLVILDQTKEVSKMESDVLKVPKQADAKKGWCNKPTKSQFQSFFTRKIFMLSKHYESTKVNYFYESSGFL